MPKKTDDATTMSQISAIHHEIINPQLLQNVIDNLNTIIPVEKQTYTLNGEKIIDQRIILKDMLKNIKGDNLQVIYLYSKNSQTHGRQYARAGRSLQSLSRVIRHTLCRETYRDFDIKNCHPTIALHVFKSKGYDCKNLQYYIDNRDKCLTEVMTMNNITKEDAKDVFISILNGGQKAYKGLTNKPTFIYSLYDEQNTNIDNLLKEDEIQPIITHVKKIESGKPKNKRKNDFEIRASVCNRVWVDKENEILVSCVKFLESEDIDIKNIVLMFDGFMLPINEANKFGSGWLRNLSEWIFINNHIWVDFSEKIMDEGYTGELKQITKYEPNLSNELTENDIIEYAINMTDAGMAKLVNTMLGDYLKFDGSRLYIYKNHRWNECCDNTFEYEISKLSKNFDELINKISMKIQQLSNKSDDAADDDETDTNSETKILKIVKAAKNKFEQSSSIRSMKKILQGMVKDELFNEQLDSQRGLIGFINGVLDLTGEKPIFRDGKPTDYISKSTNYSYNKSINNYNEADTFINELFKDRETAESFKALLGSILYGGNLDHITSFWTGAGSNGKSLVKSVLEGCLGDYVRRIPNEVYTTAKKHAGGAEPHLCELKGAHLAYSEEFDKNTVFLSGVFKNMSSTDTISTRNMYDRKQTRFTPIYKSIILSNYLPKFSAFDDAVARRIRIYNFPFKFVDNPTNEVDETTGETIIIEKQRINDLQERFKTIEMRMQFINLMAKYCRSDIKDSDEMKTILKAYFSELNPLSVWFEEVLEPSTITAFIPNEALKISFDSHRTASNLSKVQFGEFIKKLAEVKRKMVDGSQKPGIIGYKFK